MKKEIFLSVIIPMYNTENYITRCLQSLNCQTSKDFEIILIDDSSSDKSLIKAKEYLQCSNLNFSILNQEHTGQSVVRNRGISKANGEYLLFLDSDDYIESTLVEKIKLRIDKKSDIEVVVFDHRRIRANGEEINLRKQNIDYSEDIREGEEVVHSYLNNNIRLWTSSLVYKKEFIQKHNIKYPKGCYGAEDLNFIFKSLICAKKVLCIEEQLSVYCQRADSLTNKGDIKRNITVIDSMEDLANFINNTSNNTKLEDIIKTELTPEHIMYQLFGCINESNIEKVKEVLKAKKVKSYLKNAKHKSSRYGRSVMVWMKIAAYSPTLFTTMYLKRKK